MKYIHNFKGKFGITKQINGKKYYFGCYDSLEEALKVREYFMKHGWNINERFKFRKVKPYQHIMISEEGNYRVVKRINNKLTHFGTFHTLEDAQKERDLLMKFDWDLEKVCECADEGDHWLSKTMKTSFEKNPKRGWNLV